MEHEKLVRVDWESHHWLKVRAAIDNKSIGQVINLTIADIRRSGHSFKAFRTSSESYLERTNPDSLSYYSNVPAMSTEFDVAFDGELVTICAPDGRGVRMPAYIRAALGILRGKGIDTSTVTIPPNVASKYRRTVVGKFSKNVDEKLSSLSQLLSSDRSQVGLIFGSYSRREAQLDLIRDWVKAFEPSNRVRILSQDPDQTYFDFVPKSARLHPLYGMWVGMKSRCYSPNNNGYKNYGGRGIKICEQWLENPEQFFDYMDVVIGLKPSPDFSIDRIDNNGNYEPGNVRWANQKTQVNNRRTREQVLLDDMSQEKIWP